MANGPKKAINWAQLIQLILTILAALPKPTPAPVSADAKAKAKAGQAVEPSECCEDACDALDCAISCQAHALCCAVMARAALEDAEDNPDDEP